MLPIPIVRPAEFRRRNVYRTTQCEACYAPMSVSPRGRPRKTCSAKCRQNYHRRELHNHRDYWPNRSARAAERVLRRSERFRGRADETPLSPGRVVTRRDQIVFDLRHDVPLENCQWCARPMTRHAGLGGRRRCCSKACRQKFLEYCHRFDDAMILVGRQLDPIVKMRLRDFVFYGDKPPGVLRFEVNICGHCRMPYPVYGLTSKYCSQRCRQAAWRRATRLCKFCGKRFRVDRHHVRKHIYCSIACKELAHNRLPPLAVERACPECGTSFIANRHTYTHQIYCCPQCKDRANYRKRRAALPPPVAVERVCRGCGTAFTVNRQSDGRQQYCSRACSDRVSARSYRARKSGRIVPIELPAGLKPLTRDANNLPVLRDR
jgi:hypothetical protein